MVVLDKKDYIEKPWNLLEQPAYRTIGRDPTNKLKVKFLTMLRKIKRESGMEESLCKAMYPTGFTIPQVLWIAQNSQNWQHTPAYCIE